MKSRILAKRYAMGLVRALRSPEEFSSVSRELEDFSRLLSEQPLLQEILGTPFLPAEKKEQIAHRVMDLTALGGKTRRFLLLLVEKNRLSLLGGILERLPLLWNEEQGIASYEVFSAVPLSEEQKKRLAEKLSRLEDRPVVLACRIDSGLIAGLSVRKGNTVYDASLRGELERIKQSIAEG